MGERERENEQISPPRSITIWDNVTGHVDSPISQLYTFVTWCGRRFSVGKSSWKDLKSDSNELVLSQVPILVWIKIQEFDRLTSNACF